MSLISLNLSFHHSVLTTSILQSGIFNQLSIVDWESLPLVSIVAKYQTWVQIKTGQTLEELFIMWLQKRSLTAP